MKKSRFLTCVCFSFLTFSAGTCLGQTPIQPPDTVAATVPGTTVPVTAIPVAEAKQDFLKVYPMWVGAHGRLNGSKLYVFDGLPLLMVTQAETDDSVTSYNWGRLTYGVASAYSNGLKGVISVDIPNRSGRAYVYMVDAKTNTVDMSNLPENRALTYKIKSGHYGELPALDFSSAKGILASSYIHFGLSTNNFGGQKSDQGNKSVFILGPGIEVGPYFGFNFGLAFLNNSNGKVSTGLSLGVTIDPTIIGKIF